MKINKSALIKDFYVEMKYIALIAKEDVEIEYEGKKYHFNAPKKIRISSLFFRNYTCMSNAGCCKIPFYKFWGQIEYKEIPEENKKDLQEIEMKVNGHIKKIYVGQRHKNECQYLKNNKCLIHNWKPLHCKMPLIKFIYNKNLRRTNIIKSPFARNLCKNCCATLIEGLNEKQFKDDMVMFDWIEKLSKEWNIKTYIKEIKKILEYMYHKQPYQTPFILDSSNTKLRYNNE